MDAKGGNAKIRGQSHWLEDAEMMREAARRRNTLLLHVGGILRSRKIREDSPSCSRSRARNAKQDGTSCAVSEDPRNEDLSVVEDEVLDAGEQRNDSDGDVSAHGSAYHAGYRARSKTIVKKEAKRISFCMLNFRSWVLFSQWRDARS